MLRGLAAAIAAAAILRAGTAAADTGASETPARAAYDRGVAAFQKGDYAVAAHEFATADALSPNAVALHAGLDAAVRADEAVLGMELAERAKRVTGDTALEAAAR